jgi:hypothetical protein
MKRTGALPAVNAALDALDALDAKAAPAPGRGRRKPPARRAASAGDVVKGTLGAPAIATTVAGAFGTLAVEASGAWCITPRREALPFADDASPVEHFRFQGVETAVAGAPPREYELRVTFVAVVGQPPRVASTRLLRRFTTHGGAVTAYVDADGNPAGAEGWVGEGLDPLGPALETASTRVSLEKLHDAAQALAARAVKAERAPLEKMLAAQRKSAEARRGKRVGAIPRLVAQLVPRLLPRARRLHEAQGEPLLAILWRMLLEDLADGAFVLEDGSTVDAFTVDEGAHVWRLEKQRIGRDFDYALDGRPGHISAVRLWRIMQEESGRLSSP